jgi:hypothetical protein
MFFTALQGTEVITLLLQLLLPPKDYPFEWSEWSWSDWF